MDRLAYLIVSLTGLPNVAVDSQVRNSQKPDDLGLACRAIPDSQVTAGAQLSFDKLIQGNRSVHDVRLGQTGAILEPLKVLASLRYQGHGDPLWRRLTGNASPGAAAWIGGQDERLLEVRAVTVINTAAIRASTSSPEARATPTVPSVMRMVRTAPAMPEIADPTTPNVVTIRRAWSAGTIPCALTRWVGPTMIVSFAASVGSSEASGDGVDEEDCAAGCSAIPTASSPLMSS